MRSCTERENRREKMKMERILLASSGALGSSHAWRQRSIPQTVLSSTYFLKCEFTFFS